MPSCNCRGIGCLTAYYKIQQQEYDGKSQERKKQCTAKEGQLLYGFKRRLLRNKLKRARNIWNSYCDGVWRIDCGRRCLWTFKNVYDQLR